MAATDNRKHTLRAALTAACGLLGVAGAPAHATEVSGGVLGYVEPGRVSAFEVITDGRHEFDNGRTGTFRFVFDALTGSSANGAAPATRTQTFTSPSGGSSYTAAPGETPLDGTFSDQRLAMSGGLTFPWGRLTSATFGLYASFEHDYTSLGVNGALTRDFNHKNTTIALRGSLFADTVRPLNGAPVALSPMVAATPGGGGDKREDGEGGGGPGQSKTVTDLGVSLTQVLTRRTLLALNYTNSHVSGYQTDPYKLVSVVNGTTGDPRALSPYLYESRPDRRAKNAAAAELIQNLGRDVITLSYRYFDDDWGIISNTGEVAYRLNFAPERYLQPNFRWYQQSAADFYRHYLVDGAALPAHASGDYRLGEMKAVTYGLKYGTKLENGHDLTLRLEYYMQTGEHHPADAIGNLRDLDLFPTVDAWIVNVGYTFGD